ncbi:hypothetical protein IQ07DRAFT_586001 [Pyrenochaeta sp. DS3sAY3a]|nr:hypothetical protein IQ07DRAFT_586001 [Pyrenochaeta sp. DS3sAY3a]
MPARTKSCATCRRKRIKCDATLPHCRMCTASGQQCPGIPEGPLIVDMTKTAKHGMRKRNIKIVADNNNASTLNWMESNNARLYRISQRAMMTDAFYGRFLTFFTSEGEGRDIQNRLTWLHRLPLLSTDGTNEALILALQATAAAYCAVDSTNVALVRYAWNLYGNALRTHSRFLARARGKHEVTVHMVSTSVLFSFFEAMQATSTNAYRSHIYGAAKMLEVTGPEQCTQGVLCQIFYHLRTQMAFVHLTGIGKETPVEVRKILYGTLEYTQLPMFQRLMSHVATLAEMYVKLKEDSEKKDFDLATYAVVENELRNLWQEYTETAAERNERLRWEDDSTGSVRFRDAFTALTMAYFDTAHILMAIVAPKLVDSWSRYQTRFTAIMEAAQELQVHDIGCAYMRMATPILLVALHSPKKKQRAQAIECFQRWQGGNMRGISSMALEMIYQQQETASEHDPS